MRCPAAIPAIALGAGIAAGIFFSVSLHITALVCVWVAALCAFAAHHQVATTATLVLGFFLAGMSLGHDADSASRNQALRAFFDRQRPPGEHQIFANVEGMLRTDAVRGASGVTLNLFIDRIEVNGTISQTGGGASIGVGGDPAADQVLQWRAGRRVAFPATLRPPTRYLNPGVADGERQSAWRGTALVGSVKSGRLVEVVARGGIAHESFASARALVRRAVMSTVGTRSARSAAVVLAILIGDRAGLDHEVQRRLQDAGTYHVIAISGGNIAIIAGLFVLLFRVSRLGVRMSALLVASLLGAYALAVEGGPSVARAALMAIIYFSLHAWDRRAAPPNVAALTAAVLFCVDPLEAVDPGFALTFGATLGILVGMSRVGSARSGWARAPATLLIASACAEIALLPISAFVFSRVTFAGLVVNFAAIPLMTIAQVAGIAIVFASLCLPAVAFWIGGIAHLAVEGLIGSAALVDWLPWLTRRLAPPSLWAIAIYYGALGVALVHVFRPPVIPRRAAVFTAIACAVWIVMAPADVLSRKRHVLRVTFLDVGQGDSAIVQFPDGRTLSIDAGGVASTAFNIAERVISPAFWALGVRRLDYMSITHGDADHIGGATALFRDFKPFEVWEGVPVPPHLPTRELRMLADASGAAWRTVQPLDRMSFGEVNLVVHHPPHPEWERQRVRNDDSAVIELRYDGVSLVFTGDISRDVEHIIAPSFQRAPIRVVKVPHHGSATSSSPLFLDALRPDVAVVSAGRGNPFGHPVPVVLARYRDLGAAIYRTDHDGAVTVETDGTTMRVKTFTGRTLTLTTHGRDTMAR
jgi:competence protein ComEC